MLGYFALNFDSCHVHVGLNYRLGPARPFTQVIGAGPTGVEFTGELTDLIGNDVPRLFPELVGLINLTVVSSGKVLPMFEEVWRDKNVRMWANVPRQRPNLPEGGMLVRTAVCTRT